MRSAHSSTSFSGLGLQASGSKTRRLDFRTMLRLHSETRTRARNGLYAIFGGGGCGLQSPRVRCHSMAERIMWAGGRFGGRAPSGAPGALRAREDSHRHWSTSVRHRCTKNKDHPPPLSILPSRVRAVRERWQKWPALNEIAQKKKKERERSPTCFVEQIFRTRA